MTRKKKMTDSTETFEDDMDGMEEENFIPHPDHPNDYAPKGERFSEFPPGYGPLGYMTLEENQERCEALWKVHNTFSPDDDDEKFLDDPDDDGEDEAEDFLDEIAD